MTTTIVIGGNHYNTLWLVRSLGMAKVATDLIIFDKEEKSFVCKCKYLCSCKIVHESQSLVKTLLDRKSSHKKVIISSSDVVSEILDYNYDKLKDFYFLPNCGRASGGLTYWMKKNHFLSVAQEIGISIPQTYLFHIGQDSVDEFEIQYPCLLKPQASVYGHKEDFRICYEDKELLASLNDLKYSCKDILIQQYIKRNYEFVINGIRYNNQHIIPGVVVKTKVGQKLHNMGMTTIAYTDAKISKYINPKLIEQLMDHIGYEGLYSVEFIVSDGKPYLLEINFRSDATIYISTRGGVNLPFLWYSLVSNHAKRTCSYSEKVWGMAEVSYVKELPWKKPWQIVRDWWKTDCYSIFSWKDIKPFFYKFIYAI